ncbi:MAG: copper chaperone PCu(A)C [Azoarcus sp.]|nr:copper chaperone PCu(A)C [Azoarcus sp.]
MKMKIVASLFATLVSSATLAQVAVTDPWVRATVPQQKATGAFMQITAPADARLVEARSPVANIVEIHEMVMDKDVMKMRAISGIDLPAGKAVELKPGGYHVMLIDLNAQVKEGDVVPLTVVIEGKDGKRESIELKAAARPLNSSGVMPMHKH